MSRARDIADGQQNFVNVTGDTMSGNLKVQVFGNATSSVQYGTGLEAKLNAYAAETALELPAPSTMFKLRGKAGALDTLTLGATYSGTEREGIVLDYLGRVTTPYQPAFEGNGSGQAVTAGAYTIFTFNIEFNRGSYFNGTTFTAPVSGVYAFHGRMEWNGSGADAGSLYLAVNGSATYQFLEYASGYYNGPSFSKMVSLSANDYVQLWTFGNNFNSGTTYSHRFGGYLVG